MATIYGYIPTDWQTIGRAELFRRAEQAKILAYRFPNLRDFYETQAEYLNEAAVYEGEHIDV